ncbi:MULTISPECIES: cysteine hydrolase family protein [Streptomyces]|jgi:nicotinamidase-related amidase|uniref:Isochorismatase family protein n=4 Tax=Streptomyces TaxID=1883 RepID=A0A1G7DRM0_9ACTN|nr:MULTISPECIES: isochorismatase family protein [Streptomyces]EGG46939.1 putative isochorismatase [Streptomyces griseoaurantiacus M045]MBA5225558.1 isochorismatase family protein [Streptomyces griseoaurantiacus]MDX3092267.1 isochorismatase family protein [Streptomyces sp. ME12-02E]MDX3335632.1 isochorismatase family protein [Streptomyces sp. ME02-6978a]WTI25370.1 isochorismatase family protein [Streptomyces jietaisiensis]
MKRALVVVDVQESFRARPLWESIDKPDIARPVNRLVALAREAGDLVVWILHTAPGSGDVFDPDSGHVRLLAELDGPRPGEPVLRKTSHNAFTTTSLQQLLTEAGVGELWICGIRVEQCVETTTRLGSDLGYRMVLVPEASATNPIGDLSAEEITERTVAVLRDRFARIATVAELAADVAASSA